MASRHINCIQQCRRRWSRGSGKFYYFIVECLVLYTIYYFLIWYLIDYFISLSVLLLDTVIISSLSYRCYPYTSVIDIHIQPQITRDINKNDARRLYNGGDSGGANTALQESEIPDQCFRDVLWTEEQCRNYVEGNNVPGVSIFAGGVDRSPVKGCFYSVSRREAYWGNYPLNPANDDYLTRVGEDFNNGRRVRIFCNNNVVPTSSPTEGKYSTNSPCNMCVNIV